MAVTKMAAGDVPGSGVLLKGRVRNDVQSPDTSSSFSISPPESGRPDTGKRSSSSPSSSISMEMKARRSPRLMAATRPLPGEVNNTAGFFLSLNSG